MSRRYRRPTASRIIFLSFMVFILLILFKACCNSMIDDSSGNHLLYKMPTVIIDPGHGGFDGGAEGIDNIIEKDINLSISLKLRDMLQFMGYEVVMIRDGDYSIEDDCTKSLSERKTSDMENRLKFYNNYENPIFISIHQNKFEQSNCKGAQIFYGRFNSKSKKFAEILRDNIRRNIDIHNKREIKKGDRNLFLLYNAKCPIILVECGFISNYKESKLLTDNEYQSKFAFVIARSVIDFTSDMVPQSFTLFKNKV